MENTIENKEKFFAQYWGQRLLTYGKQKGYLVNHFLDGNYTKAFLELTSLSDITDEDAIEVAKMALGYSKLPQQINISETVNRKIGFGFSFWLNGESEYQIDLGNFYNPKLFCLNRHTSPSEYLHNALKISDYLRSRGYALPWLGVSVEEQIKRGWIKLKTK